MARLSAAALYATPKDIAREKMIAAGKNASRAGLASGGGMGTAQARAMLNNRLARPPKGMGGRGNGGLAYSGVGQMQYQQQMNQGGGGRRKGSMIGQRMFDLPPGETISSMTARGVTNFAPWRINPNSPAVTQAPTQVGSNPSDLLGIDYTSVGGVDPGTIDQVMDYYINEGLSPQGAAYLTGSLIQESRLNPNATGDNGTAFGVNQWRFERREGMPNDLMGQVDFALDEMDRDGIARQNRVSQTLRDPNASVQDVQRAIERWTRWGHLGDRWNYGAQLYRQLGY